MLTTNRPIIINYLVGETYAGQYVKYSVRHVYADASTIYTTGVYIYYGKAFVGGDGYINIDLTEVVRDYAYRPDLQYNTSMQNWEPKDLMLSTDTVYPIEYQNVNSQTCKFKLGITLPDTDTQNDTHTLDITPYFTPEWYSEFEYEQPYTTSETGFIMKNKSGILPHLPYVITKNYFYTMPFGKYASDQSNYNWGIYDEYGNSITITSPYAGNYVCSITLQDLWVSMGYIGGGETQPSDGDMLSNPLDKDAIIDTCTSRFYVAWWTPWGEWQSQPLSSLMVKETTDNFDITTTRRITRNIQNRAETTLVGRTNKLTKDYYNLYATMIYSPYVLVYDVEKDRNYWCTVGTTDIDVKDRTATPRTISLEFNQINKTIC